VTPRGAAALLALTAAAQAAPPELGALDSRARAGRNQVEARIENIHGVLRLRLAGVLSLRDAVGAYLLVRLEARNARDRSAVLRRANLVLRQADGPWVDPEGVADRPPLAGPDLRPNLALAGDVAVPRDQTRDVFAVFRTEADPTKVDVAARYDGRPYFLRRPLVATPEQLADDAVRFARERRFAFARGLLADAGRTRGDTIRMGARLLVAARRLRAADQPVMEDRVLRLALPVAPNPTYVHARLAELRREQARKHPQESWRPARPIEGYHRRRAEQYRVDEDVR
jgi:hypothetical protein